MNETQPQDFEEILADRLLRRVESDDFETADNDDELLKQQTSRQLIQTERAAAPALPIATFAKVEKSLISLGFFTPSSSRIKSQRVKRISFTRTIDGKKIEATAEFHPSAMLGLPITADQDKFFALHSIITNLLKDNGTVSNPIRFTSAELLRLLNKRVRTGKNYKDISEWLDVMTSTTIMSNGVVWEAGKQRFARDRFHVFERAVSVGKVLPDGTIADANYVWLSDWQLENINQKFLLPIDLVAYRELKNRISKALVPLLQVWLYASQRAGSFEKRYDELCEMLGLKAFRTSSRITQQLKASLDELTRYGYLKQWRIERTAAKDSLKIIFIHGDKFHRDRRRRLAEKSEAPPPVVVAESDPGDLDLPEPEKLRAPVEPVPSAPINEADLPEREGADESLESRQVGELSARGLMPEVARRLLRSLPPERLADVESYVDYWDEARKARPVGEGFLYSLIKDGAPLPANFETRGQREARIQRERRREKLRSLHTEMKELYEQDCNVLIDRFIDNGLGQEAFQKRVEERVVEILGDGGFFAGLDNPEIVRGLAAADVRRKIGAELAPAYGDFYEERLPTVLERLGLVADDLDLGMAEVPGGRALNGSSPETGQEPPVDGRPIAQRQMDSDTLEERHLSSAC